MPEESIPDRMQVPRFVGNGAIEWAERPVPEPGPGQLLLRVRANALCGSERGQFYNGSPVTPGHETAGVVAAAGPGTHTPLRTPGVVFLMDFCGECRSCRAGATNQCLAKRADMGFNRDGGYGPYELVSESIFFPVDPDIPLPQATLLLDIMGTGGHAIGRAQILHSDIRSVVITGAGPIGLGVLAMARILLGNDIPILITDMIEYRLALAARLGGTPIRPQDGSLTDVVRKHVRSGTDLAVDTSGKSGARRAAIDALGQRGLMVCVGHGEGLTLDVSRDLIAPERAVLGSEYFCYHELPANLERLRQHRDFLRQIITHRFGVQDLEQAFQSFFKGETGKVIIDHRKVKGEGDAQQGTGN